MDNITTVLGDTWDSIARRAYGDEAKAQALMEARENIRLLDYEVFPGGITVAVPELPDEPGTADLPDWRK
jgi:phage tail protein X